ncbi:hypothetical protein GFK26_18300 [Variovorax paradoxus]|uniref:Uncharacterized protein n=1 Tax=Variovorax paradoxus TaxID=34073 RepID=A0A5Q0M4A8_VARPD|nr:hypothetical protein [Variovorax paradoxus]QFZ84580.1 hypothetical protein GFK26_18300 [Variovorax paradoxus]
MSFCGPGFDPTLDEERLNEQILRVYRCMNDSTWRTLGELSEATGDPEASVSAQLRNLRKVEYGSFVVERRRRGLATTGLWEYQLLPPGSSATTTLGKKSRRNPFLEGMKHAAKVLVSAADLAAAKAAMKSELLQAHKRATGKP